MPTAEACLADGCNNSLMCKHPSDPKCVRSAPSSTDPNLARNREQVDHPSHYGGENNPYEAIKVIQAWNLGFCLGNAIKYISRAGKKDPAKLVEDLEKARWYLDEAIKRAKTGVDRKQL